MLPLPFSWEMDYNSVIHEKVFLPARNDGRAFTKPFGKEMEMMKTAKASFMPAWSFLVSAIPIVLTVSIFLPHSVTKTVVYLIAGLVVCSRELRERVFDNPWASWLVLPMLIPFYIAAFYRNYNGIVEMALLLAAVICAMYLRTVMTRELFGRLLHIACLCSIVCAGVAVAQKVMMWSSNPLFRPESVFFNANYYGTMAVFMVLVGIYQILNHVRFRWVYLLTVFANLLGLYLCASMSSLATMVISVMAMLLMYRRKKLVIIGALLVLAGGVLVMLAPELYPRLGDVEDTFGSRVTIWSTALKGIMETPLFGRGPKAYPLAYAQFGGYDTYHCHNLLLDALLNFGIVGTGLMGVFVICQARQLYLRYKNYICREQTILIAAVSLAVLVHGITDVTVSWIQTGMFYLLLFSSSGIRPAWRTIPRRLTVPGMLSMPAPFLR